MDNPLQILEHLNARERQFRLRTLGMMFGGAALSLIGPLFISALFWVAYLQIKSMYWRWYPTIPWSWFFLGLCIVLIPVLLRLELKARGDDLARAAKEFDPEGGVAAAKGMQSFVHVGMIAAALANPRAALPGFVEIFMAGPRLIVTAWRQRRLRGLAGGVDHLRAAQVIQTLAGSIGHVRTDTLLKEGEAPANLARILAYLVFFDWIDAAHDGTKVWILTETRVAIHAPEPEAPSPAMARSTR